MIQQSNYKARQSLNKQYAAIKGASAINDVAMGFGKGWIVFAILSTMASAFSFYQDFNKSLGVIITLLLVTILASALEAFKHLSIKGMFSDMHLISRSLVTIVAVGLIGISFYTHYKSIKTFQSNLVNTDLKEEIAYQRDLQKVQNGQISTILATNAELAKALNNGTSHDDEESSSSVKSNNQLITTLQKLAAQNNMHNTTLLLQESRSSAQTTASAILVIFIMIEIMALFSILSKIIVVDNVSDNVKNFFGLMDRLDELETNTYESLGYQRVEQTHEKIKVTQEAQAREHQKEIKKIQSHPTLKNRPKGQEEIPQITENMKLPFYANYYGKNIEQINQEQSPQVHGVDAKQSTGINPMAMTIYPNTLPVKYPLSNPTDDRRIADKKKTENLTNIKKIADVDGDLWLYYKNWIILEESCSLPNISYRIGSQIEEGFTEEKLLSKSTKTFEIMTQLIHKKEQLDWINRVEEANKKYSNIVEAEMIEEEKDETIVNPFNEKVPAIDIKLYDPDEQKLLRELYDNGAITIGQNLIGRRHVLKAVGKMKKKSETLSLLYEKLFENGYIDKKQVNPNNSIYKYVALAELHRHNWQEK